MLRDLRSQVLATSGDFGNLANIWASIPLAVEAEAACLAQSLERSQAAAPLSCMVPELKVGSVLADPGLLSSCLDICHWCVSLATAQPSFPPSWVLS